MTRKRTKGRHQPAPRQPTVLRAVTRDARFQEWQALLTNRSKRQRRGEVLVQGVRPINLALQHGWSVTTLLYDGGRALSRWAADILARTTAARVALPPELLRELGGKLEDVPELLAIVKLPADDLERIAVADDFLGVVFDRPTSPGNIGTLVRSADAFGASGVIITGHAADPYDPKAVRASTGSIFAIPIVRAPSHREVVDWVAAVRARGIPLVVVGTDEKAPRDLADSDLSRPTLFVIGNETTGMSSAWRAACDEMVRIPIAGSASSLNAAVSATVCLYETARQRGYGRGLPQE
jgi:TrmH family RNA methyltransferase